MRISIVGAGYVGLVSGACLADRGHDVICVDLDPDKVAAINAGRAPIHEPGLEAVLRRVAGRSFAATQDLDAAVGRSEVTFIAVGTPAAAGRIDLRFVERAAREIGRVLRGKDGRHSVIVKSTVIPGTTDGVVRRALEEESGKIAGRGFGLGMNPEFLTEGRAVHDFSHPDRIVLGGTGPETHAVLEEVYAGFPGVPLIRVNNSTAEMIKYASNALLATCISFANELSSICARLGDVDITEVMSGVHQSQYLTSEASAPGPVTAPIARFLEAGCGFGGSCLPKDVTALVGQGRDLGLPMPLLSAVLEVNRGQPDEILRLIRKRHLDLRGLPVSVLGFAFKPDTDDTRESPAFPILGRLAVAGALLTAWDPVASPDGKPELAGVRIAGSLQEALDGARVVVIVTRWPEIERVPGLLAGSAEPALVIDGRRMLEKGSVSAYEGIGR